MRNSADIKLTFIYRFQRETNYSCHHSSSCACEAMFYAAWENGGSGLSSPDVPNGHWVTAPFRSFVGYSIIDQARAHTAFYALQATWRAWMQPICVALTKLCVISSDKRRSTVCWFPLQMLHQTACHRDPQTWDSGGNIGGSRNIRAQLWISSMFGLPTDTIRIALFFQP